LLLEEYPWEDELLLGSAYTLLVPEEELDLLVVLLL
jgi:hypothetical protein